MFTDIKPRTLYSCKGKVVEVDGFESSTVVTVRDVATGEIRSVPTHELGPIEAERALPIDVAKISQPKWDEAKRTYDVLADTLHMDQLDADTSWQMARTLGCSVRKVQRLRKKLRKACRVSTVVPKRGRKQGSRGLHPKTERAIDGQIRRFYLRRERPGVNALLERVEAVCRRAKCPVPSYGSVKRRILDLDEAYVMKRRQGPKAARQKYAPRPGSLQVTEPLGLVEIDHSRMDVMPVTDDEYREEFLRPWLTIAIDVYSRSILGFYLALHAPNSTSVGMCIAHSILPKDDYLKAYGINAKWPMHGRPKMILTDNATEFKGTAMARGCDEMRIALGHRPVGRPYYGAHVERAFGTLMKRTHLIPGTTFSNVHEKGKEYSSEERSCLTLSEINHWLVNEICNRYHVTYHRGIGMTPSQAWEKGVLASVPTSREVH